MFRLWLETSLQGLYQSAVDNFPETEHRQHSIDPIRITQMHWTAFPGVGTLFIKGLAVNEGRHYSPIILFKNVNYNPEDGVQFTATNGNEYTIEPLNREGNDALVRCPCKDFFFPVQSL